MPHGVVNIIKEIKELETDKIIRPNLGDASFKEFEPILEELQLKIDFIERFNETVDNNTNNNVNNHLNQIRNHLNELIGYDKSQFVAQQQQIKKNVTAQLDAIRLAWPHYATAAIEDSGLLTNIDIKKEFESLTKNLKTSTDEALQKIEEESNQIIEEAKKKAAAIETSVRKTARGVSVEVAQQQFEEATTQNLGQIKIWGGISGVLIVTFIGLVIYLLNVELPNDYSWQMIYYSVVRIAVLTLVGSLLSYSLKVLRSHLHMFQHNLHRKRVANSMAAFTESANTSEQRDLILTQLVESVTAFGNSGLVGKDDEQHGKISIDNITRTVSAIKSKD